MDFVGLSYTVITLHHTPKHDILDLIKHSTLNPLIINKIKMEYFNLNQEIYFIG